MTDGWNHEAWLDRLNASLTVAGNGYLKASFEDEELETVAHWPARPMNKTTFAAMTISAINSAMMELPGMKNHVGLAPIHDLLAALLDLGHGGRPPLLQPAKGVGKGVESSARRIVRLYAINFVGLLERTGTRPVSSAIAEVAEMLSKAGHRGFKGAPLSAGTVKGWWNTSRQRNYADKDPNAAAAHRRFKEHVERRPDWPFSPAEARAFIRAIIDSPAMRSKVG